MAKAKKGTLLRKRECSPDERELLHTTKPAVVEFPEGSEQRRDEVLRRMLTMPPHPKIAPKRRSPAKGGAWKGSHDQ